jgi:thiol-disulfide isomerase/thioredoxin
VRPPVDHIAAPPFPPGLPWINVAMLRMDQQAGRPVLIEFWDFCRPNSLRTLPYLKAWHERYEPAGLRVIGVHAGGFPPSREVDSVREAVARLQIPYPVVVDTEWEVWQMYGNFGWPSRYLFSPQGNLFEYHYGEGGYLETEQAIQELTGVVGEPLAPLRPEDAPGAALVPQSQEREGLFSGPYEAGGVWAVLEGRGSLTANGRPIPVTHPGAYELVHHRRSTAGELTLEPGPGVTCHAVIFTPGLAQDPAG